MKLLQLSICLTIIFSPTVFSRRYNRMGNQNAIMGTLQGMMGPQNYEKAMSMMPKYEKPLPIVPQPTLTTEISMPNMRFVEPKYPCQMERRYPMEVGPKNMAIYPNLPAPVNPMPQMVYPPATPEIILPISYSVPAPAPAPAPVIERRGCPCSNLSPAPFVNPLLPSASPISAWAPPVSNLLPPVDPSQVRSHFLRKIPIPPPTL